MAVQSGRSAFGSVAVDDAPVRAFDGWCPPGDAEAAWRASATAGAGGDQPRPGGEGVVSMHCGSAGSSALHDL